MDDRQRQTGSLPVKVFHSKRAHVSRRIFTPILRHFLFFPFLSIPWSASLSVLFTNAVGGCGISLPRSRQACRIPASLLILFHGLLNQRKATTRCQGRSCWLLESTDIVAVYRPPLIMQIVSCVYRRAYRSATAVGFEKQRNASVGSLLELNVCPCLSSVVENKSIGIRTNNDLTMQR